MEMVNIKINGMPFSVPGGISILEAARYAGIEIPTLCFLKDMNENPMWYLGGLTEDEEEEDEEEEDDD